MGVTTVARQCSLCEAHCGILVTIDSDAGQDEATDRVVRIEGNPQDVLSRGYICPKATAMGGCTTILIGCARRCAASVAPLSRSGGTRRSAR